MILKLRTPSDRLKAIDYLQKLPESKQYDVTISIHNPNRTISQNALYWAHIKCIAEYCGNGKDFTHDEMRKKFLPCTEGKLGREPISTTTLNTKQMGEYMDEIRLWAAEFLELRLLTPDDLAFAEYVDYYSTR